MNRKVKVITAYILSLVLVAVNFLEFVVPVEAAETGFAENAIIISDTATEYCWNDSTVNLSVVVLNGTNLTWKANRTDGITITEGKDTEDKAGTAKHAAVAIDGTASGEYKITAETEKDSRTITLYVYNSLSEIQGAVVTDFTNQYTENSFEVKVVVKEEYANDLQWVSADETKISLDFSKAREDATIYPGSVVKYIPVSILEKPENGVCDITATANGVTKTQSIQIRKSAADMKNLKVSATSYQEDDPDFDLETYNHMSSDTIYVDMEETITLTGMVEGTLVNSEKEVGAALSSSDIDDLLGIASTEKETSGSFSIGNGKYTKLSDTSYQFEFQLTGEKATSIEQPIEINIYTGSGKVSNRKNLVVLAPAQNMTFTMNTTEGTVVKELEHTAVGLCLKEDEASFKTTDFNALHTLKVLSEKNGEFTCTQNTKNIEGSTVNMDKGATLRLSAIFRSFFKSSDKKYVVSSTDTPLWKSADETKVTVTNDGVIKAVKGGETTIYCYAAPTKTSPRTNIYAAYTVNVSNINLAESIYITKANGQEQEAIENDTIYTYQKNIEYSAQLVDADKIANERITWSSSDPSVFTVVDENVGIVNPVAAGKANLIATAIYSGLQAIIPIEVIASVETVQIVETKTTKNYVEGHTYTLTTYINEGADPNEELTWTVENTVEEDSSEAGSSPVVVFIDPDDSEKNELTEFKGRTVQVKVKKSGSATVTVKGKFNASAIDTCSLTCEPERNAVYTYINYGTGQAAVDYAGKELTVNKGTNVQLNAVLLDSNKIESNDDFQWEIIQEGEVVKVTNETLYNKKSLTIQPLTKGDATVRLRNLQTNKVLQVILHVKVPATDISLKESQINEVMLVTGEVGTVGVTYQLKPILTPADSSDVVTYESADPSIVKVDENGLLTAVKSSETPVTITAKINDTLKATCQVRVAIPITELKAQDANGNVIENNGVIKVYKDDTNEIQLNCGNATEYIEWTSKSEKIASLKESSDTYSCTINGNVAGETTLTAVSSVSQKTMKFTVKVVNRIEEITLKGSTSIAINATNGYVSTTLPKNSDDIIWTVDNPEIVELTPVRSGNVAKVNLTPKKVGKTVITATSADGACAATREIEVTSLALSSVSVKVEGNVVYDGTEKKPKIKVTLSKKELVEGEDYVLTYSNNVNSGKGTITLSTGNNGNYTGTKEVTFKINKRDIDNAQVNKINDAAYTGTDIKPEIIVYDLGKKLALNTDYTLSYSDNKKAGTATIKVQGKGNYDGTKKITFKITPKSISAVKISKIANQSYTGKAIKPSLTIKNGSTKLYANRDYMVTFSANKNPGKAKAVIVGTGNYTGSKTVYFYITPAKANISSVKSTVAKSMKIKWKRDKKATGYQIYYATNSKFKGKKTVNITKNKTTSKTVKKLKTNKTYYVKIRSYKKVGSKKVYGAWSSVQSVTVK